MAHSNKIIACQITPCALTSVTDESYLLDLGSVNSSSMGISKIKAKIHKKMYDVLHIDITLSFSLSFG